jgi:hypothetical protein
MACQSQVFQIVPGFLERLRSLAEPTDLSKPTVLSNIFDPRWFLQEDDEETCKDICCYLVEGRCTYGKDCWSYHPPPALSECLKCGCVPMRYGLLQNCPHPYCLTCVLSRSDLRQLCPFCSNSKHFVASCLFISNPQQKQRLFKRKGLSLLRPRAAMSLFPGVLVPVDEIPLY